MPESALGVLLKKMREQRGLSFRELGRLAELDHAYIYRLEAGDKDDPSTEALGKLTRALKAGKLVIGATGSVSSYVLPKVLKRFLAMPRIYRVPALAARWEAAARANIAAELAGLG